MTIRINLRNIWPYSQDYESYEGDEEREEVEDQAKLYYTPPPLEPILNIELPTLDEHQSPPVDYDDSTYLVAGPGSGKTRCLISKAYNLYKNKIPFIALTYTVKAAEEMRDRLSNDPEDPLLRERVGTIHSFCLTWIDKEKPGYKAVFLKSFNFKKLLIDFLNLERKPTFPWVLIDEVQDISVLQLKVIHSVCSGKLFAVGDPYQSIYDFPGADALGEVIEPILLEDFGCKKFELVYNYRSTPKMVKNIEGIYSRGLVSASTNSFPNTIGILARTNKDVDLIEELLYWNDIDYTRKRRGQKFPGDIETKGNSQRLFTMTNHCCKGLEFKEVFVLLWDINSESETRLEYVVMSRAMTRCRFFISPSELVEEVIKCQSA